jgi:hypothetical protein
MVRNFHNLLFPLSCCEDHSVSHYESGLQEIKCTGPTRRPASTLGPLTRPRSGISLLGGSSRSLARLLLVWPSRPRPRSPFAQDLILAPLHSDRDSDRDSRHAALSRWSTRRCRPLQWQRRATLLRSRSRGDWARVRACATAAVRIMQPRPLTTSLSSARRKRCFTVDC